MIDVDLRLSRPGFELSAAFATQARVLALFGPSGAGKSTIAHLIAGLSRPDQGRVAIDGATLTDTARGICLPPEKRRIGFVFQDALLFPHLSVRRNILFGRFFTPSAERRVPIAPVIETLGIGPLMERRPATLSGGEKQRVGLARALLASPRLLLMDEPMASLDHARRQEIMGLIETIARRIRHSDRARVAFRGRDYAAGGRGRRARSRARRREQARRPRRCPARAG